MVVLVGQIDWPAQSLVWPLEFVSSKLWYTIFSVPSMQRVTMPDNPSMLCLPYCS